MEGAGGAAMAASALAGAGLVSSKTAASTGSAGSILSQVVFLSAMSSLLSPLRREGMRPAKKLEVTF